MSLPVYAEPAGRDRLYLAVGEVHDPKRPASLLQKVLYD